MAGVFEGIRVVDFAQGTAGPLAGLLLAEQGADVIKVEPPEGDRSRGTPAYHVLNRSKRGIVLDLTEGQDRDQALELVATADVVLVDEIPERAERLGIDFAGLSQRNSRLVYCSVPLYGSKGRYAAVEANDYALAALSGIFGCQLADDPVYLVTPVAAYATGVLAAGAVAAGLFDRARVGEGDAVEVPGMGGAFAIQSSGYLAPLGAMEIIRVSQLHGDTKGPAPSYRVYEAADGEWLMVAALTFAFTTKMLVTLDAADVLADPRFESLPWIIPDADALQELKVRMEPAFRTKTRDEWLEVLRQADIPCGPVLTRDQYLDDPQIIHNGMRVELDDPEVGPTVQMGIPVTLGGAPGAIRGPAPLLGQDDDAVRSDPWPLPAVAVPGGKAIPPGRPPLDGITVLDLGTTYAGPFNASLLADLGANVIKIEALDGDPYRALGISFMGINRGKRALTMDLKSDAGLQILYEMVRKADVVVENFRVGVTKRLKVDYETLSAINPRIVYCSVTPYGPDGPLSAFPGYDPILGARSGMQRAQGGEQGEPFYHQTMAIDLTTALMGTYGVCAALYCRQVTGRGQHVDTCLANNAMTAQAAEFVRYAGRPPDIAGGPRLVGTTAVHRIFACAEENSWLFLAARTKEQAQALLNVTGDLGYSVDELLRAPARGDAASALEQFFAARRREEVIEALLANGVPCVPCLSFADLFKEEHHIANDMWWDAEFPLLGPFRQIGAMMKWHRHAMRLEKVAPMFGEDSREVLAEFGVAPERIEELIQKGVVRVP